MAFDAWPHQKNGVGLVKESLLNGERRLCLTSPTGSGKTWMTQDIINWQVARGGRCVLYSSRKLLTEQIMQQLQESGIHYGVRAADFEEHDDPTAPVQLCSIQTEHSRVILKRRKMQLSENSGRMFRPLPQADLVLIDEAHQATADQAANIINEHYDCGAAVLGITATPLGVSHLYRKLLVAGNNSDCRRCGALIPAEMYACPEIDTRKIERVATGEFSLTDIRKHAWSQAIYGQVHEHLLRLNPDMKPFIIFAPGVEESVGFEASMRAKGLRVAHIDGMDCVLDGERYTSDRNARRQILDEVRKGTIHGLTNRFVLREAIDIRELHCCVLATPIGSLLSYVQIVGRVLRAHPSMDHAIIQDHGGNYWRHGSPNADRDDVWREFFDDPKGEQRVTDVRMERIRQEKEEVPLNCPVCGAVMLKTIGGKCYKCGTDMRGKRSRRVIERDGSLVEVTGLPVKERRVSLTPRMEAAWKRAYSMALRSKNKMTFAQARGFIASGKLHGFEDQVGRYPADNLPFMPKSERDWFSVVADVPKDRLY